MQTKFELAILKSKKDYENALRRMEEIFEAKPNTVEGKEAELLALLIETYEEEHFKIDLPDPIEAIKIRMQEMDLKQKDLIGIIGSKGIISEVLNRKRKLTVSMIRNLSQSLHIPAAVLIQETFNNN
ncbi:MAG: transcriptional regulator [Saprospiraceae bacterium]|jgi:HTH-type transcriptional regulator/antitoxin HigA|nr:transcriptional regulator [Saprospiraceae bacterium]MBK8735900.1 transcriptional regulator [Saprospiraceae bacterium]